MDLGHKKALDFRVQGFESKVQGIEFDLPAPQISLAPKFEEYITMT